MAAFYVIAMVFLGLHLFHGTWSIFQTVGSMSPHFNPKRNPLRKGIAAGFAIIVAGANISFPLAVQFGIIGCQPRSRSALALDAPGIDVEAATR